MVIDKSLALKSLESIRPAIGKSATIPALGAVWFSENGVSAYDGKHLGISAEFPGEISPCGVPGQVLLQFLARTPGNEVTLSQDAGEVTLKLGRSRVRLQSMEEKRNPWPFPYDLPSEPSFVVTPAMARALRRVLKVKVLNPNRVEHFGVIMLPGSKGSYLYATDSQLLVRAYVAGVMIEEPLILPKPFAAQLSEGAKVYLRDDAVLAVDEERLVASRMLDTTGLVDIEAVIAPYVKGNVLVDVPEDLFETIKRVWGIGRRDFEPMVKLRVNEGQLHIEGNFTFGDMIEELPVESGDLRASSTVSLNNLMRVSTKVEVMGFPAGGMLFRGKNVLYLLVGKE